MFHRILSLLIKETTQVRRDRRLMSVLIVAPVIQLLVLSYAANTDVKDVIVAVRDNDHSYHSREFIRAISSTDYFRVIHLTGSEKHDGSLLVNGDAGIVLLIPPDFGKNLICGRDAVVQALVDGSDSNFGVQGINQLQKLTMQFSQRIGAGLNIQYQTQFSKLVVQSRVWFNPELKSRYYMVPAIMAQLLMVATMLVTSMALVKEREEGTFEQLVVTPLKPMEIIIGKLLPFTLIGFIEMTIAIPVMLLILGVPFKGNFLTLYVFSALFLLSTLGLGVFISTIVKTQQQAMLFATFFVMVPFILLSGFAFPVENMPPIIQKISSFIPMSYYLVAVRGIFLKGAGFHELAPVAYKLISWGTLILIVSALKFRKRLD
ncbi:MAG: ABC transporter permease [Verrucomicrobiae bacterium]|nr:ABC transporter permease [Verrucomicrobiae bacterium]